MKSEIEKPVQTRVEPVLPVKKGSAAKRFRDQFKQNLNAAKKSAAVTAQQKTEDGEKPDKKKKKKQKEKKASNATGYGDEDGGQDYDIQRSDDDVNLNEDFDHVSEESYVESDNNQSEEKSPNDQSDNTIRLQLGKQPVLTSRVKIVIPQPQQVA